jgi:hypothetical protein
VKKRFSSHVRVFANLCNNTSDSRRDHPKRIHPIDPEESRSDGYG